MNSKLLIVTFHSLNQPWRNIAENGQLKTWLKDPLPTDVEHIAAYANELSLWLWKLDIKWWNLRASRICSVFVFSINKIFSNIFLRKLPNIRAEKFLESDFTGIRIHQPDFMNWQTRKMLALFEYILTLEFDYVYLANTSSYVRVKALKEYCEALKFEDIYGGPISTTNGITYVSGSSRLFSSNTLKNIMSRRDIYDLWGYEDVQIGKIAMSLGIGPTSIKSTEIKSLCELELYSKEMMTTNFHFRVKSGEIINRQDAEVMLAIYEKLNSYELDT